MTVVALHHVTDALLAMLATATGKPSGDGERPHDDPLVYTVVDQIAGGGPMGSASDPAGAVAVVYQVTSVATAQEPKDGARWQAEALAGRVRVAMLGRVPGTGAYVHPISGYTVNGGAKSLPVDDLLVVWDRTFDSAGGHLLEGKTSNVVDRYVLHVAPVVP